MCPIHYKFPHEITDQSMSLVKMKTPLRNSNLVCQGEEETGSRRMPSSAETHNK